MSQGLQNIPRVSVLLPTHNRADVLPFAIRSVLAQTIQDFELLIVGDGCTDNTSEIVKSFSDPRIHWYDLPKAPGFGYANRNIVLKKARGDYIAFMAHDDLWLSDHLEQLLPLFCDERIEIIYSRPLWVIPLCIIVPGLFNLNHEPTLETFLNKQNAIPASCVVHRRDCFSKYGYWNDKLPGAGDWDMWIRIIKGGRKKNFAYIGESTCLHFKANWRDESYDRVFGFRFWRRLFASDQIPACLKVEVSNGETEQEAVWEAMSSEPQEWNKKLRLAIEQVIDICAFQGNMLADALLTFNDEFMAESLTLYPSYSLDYFHFIKSFNQLQLDQKSLDDIQNTLTWKIHEYITNIYVVRKLYRMIVSPVRQWFSRAK
jgi:glycosyltransferase involved in cell wall biosynthesis